MHPAWRFYQQNSDAPRHPRPARAAKDRPNIQHKSEFIREIRQIRTLLPSCAIEWQAPNGSMSAMTHHLSLLVFSDLDGTLLSHGDYSWAKASPGLERLRALGAGLVLASSKTSAEMILLRDEIGFSDWPAIVENGAGILWPGETDIGGAQTYADLRKTIRTLPAGFVGFGDMTVQEVADQTGLDSQAARRARQRQFSEPGVWTGQPRRVGHVSGRVDKCRSERAAGRPVPDHFIRQDQGRRNVRSHQQAKARPDHRFGRRAQ